MFTLSIPDPIKKSQIKLVKVNNIYLLCISKYFYIIPQMEKTKELNDLYEIKNLMERSSRFLSLSGLSGISAGIFALIGAFTAYQILDYGHIKYDENLYLLGSEPLENIIYKLLLVGAATFFTAFGSALYFSNRKAKKNNLAIWDHTSKKLLQHLLIPLVTGGLFALILVYRNDVTLLASVTLVFYGLALVNAGKYTFGEVHYLGISEIVLGLLAGLFTNFGLIFWAIGFGLLHILYGLIMYYRYDR